MKTGNIGLRNLADIGVADIDVYGKERETLLSKMRKKKIDELYYTHIIKGAMASTVIVHYKIRDNKLFKEIIFSKLELDTKTELFYYEELLSRCGIKVCSSSLGNLVYKSANINKWNNLTSQKFSSLPHNQEYYKNKYKANNTAVSTSEEEQISKELEQIADLRTNQVNFFALAKKIQSQLEQAFYNDVNMHVYIKQIDEKGNKIKEDYLRSKQKSKDFDVKQRNKRQYYTKW